MIVDNGAYYLYRHIRLDKNEPFYVGIGKKKDRNFLSINTEYHRAYYKNRKNKTWLSICKKAGYKVEIILETNDSNFISEKEKEFILLYGRIDLKTGTLCNLCIGGTDSSSLKDVSMQKSCVGKNLKTVYIYDATNGRYLNKFRSISQAAKSIKYTANKLSIAVANKMIYKDVLYSSDYLGEIVNIGNYKERVSNGVAKVVYRINPETGTTECKYNNMREAAVHNKVSAGAIKLAVKNKRKCVGFYWSCFNTINLIDYSQCEYEIYKIRKSDLSIEQVHTSLSVCAKSENVSCQSIFYSIKNRSYCNGFLFCKKEDYELVKNMPLKNKLNKPINRVSDNGDVVSYDKIADAASEFYVNSGRICEAIKKGNVYLNYKWEYSNN